MTAVRSFSAMLVTLVAALSATAAEPRVELPRHRPCNLFNPDEKIAFQAKLKGFPEGNGAAVATLRDAFGHEILRRGIAIEGKPEVNVDMGCPGRGYYELTLTAKVTPAQGAPVEGSGSCSLGVIESVHRSAEDVRTHGYRFGLKWWGGVADRMETLAMLQRLGLQWTREIHSNTPKMLQDAPEMNVVMKVERFPKELYDEQRYGPLDEWEKKYGRGAWTLKTLPKKEPYQQRLREELAAIPKDQQTFEIWNEPWDKMSPEDFATLSQWIVEVILKERPDAIIGPNLMGDPSDYQYDAKVIQAGGMKGMKMVCLHPYGGSENREWLRAYREWISQKTGRAIEIYITEYGAHSCPEGPSKTSEVEQARRVVRQSLALYAEGCKALIPHWVGQSERNRTYHEDWFGYIRRNQEPKPVLLAHANCARLVDASRYVGDLWYGPGLDAMLFEKNGEHVLALFTKGESKEVEIDTGVAALEIVDLFGLENRAETNQGKLKLTIGPDVVYLVGVDPKLATQASKELRPDRWPKPARPPRNTRTAHRFTDPPTLDGKLDDWKGATQLAMQNPKVNGDDASGTGYLAWDAQNLYLAVEMRDNELLNNRPRAKLYQQDSIELFVSTEPREENPGYGPNDRQYFLTPTSGEGKPIVGEVVDRAAGKVSDVEGARHYFGKTANGWIAEVAIPWSALPNFKAVPGATMALDLRVNDADTSHERWKIDPLDGNPSPEDPTAWSLLRLEN